jgi:hypothetical protein
VFSEDRESAGLIDNKGEVDKTNKANLQDLIHIATDLLCGMGTRGFGRSSGITRATESRVLGDRSPTLLCHIALFLPGFAREECALYHTLVWNEW